MQINNSGSQMRQDTLIKINKSESQMSNNTATHKQELNLIPMMAVITPVVTLLVLSIPSLLS